MITPGSRRVSVVRCQWSVVRAIARQSRGRQPSGGGAGIEPILRGLEARGDRLASPLCTRLRRETKNHRQVN